mgnify:CR=1 FL=1
MRLINALFSKSGPREYLSINVGKFLMMSVIYYSHDDVNRDQGLLKYDGSDLNFHISTWAGNQVKKRFKKLRKTTQKGLKKALCLVMFLLKV